MKSLPKPTWLIQDEIPEHGLTIICGKAGVGKTFVMLEYAHRLWLQGKHVLYVVLEGKHGYYPRIAALNKHHRIDEADIAPYMRFWADPLPLLQPGVLQAFIAKLNEWKPCLVIIDTLGRAMDGADLNGPPMQEFVNACQEIQNAINGTVAVVHHARKSDGTFSGGMALYNSAETFIYVRNFDGLITIEADKVKDADLFPPRNMRLLPVLLDDGTSVPVAIESERIVQTNEDKLWPNQYKVMQIFVDVFPDGAPLGELVDVAEISKGAMLRTLASLKRLAYVAQPKTFGPYQITTTGTAKIEAAIKRSQRTHGTHLGLTQDSPSKMPTPPVNAERTHGTHLKRENFPSFFSSVQGQGGESGESASPVSPMSLDLYQRPDPIPCPVGPCPACGALDRWSFGKVTGRWYCKTCADNQVPKVRTVDPFAETQEANQPVEEGQS